MLAPENSNGLIGRVHCFVYKADHWEIGITYVFYTRYKGTGILAVVNRFSERKLFRAFLFLISLHKIFFTVLRRTGPGEGPVRAKGGMAVSNMFFTEWIFFGRRFLDIYGL